MDNGKEFTDWLFIIGKQRESGKHKFEKLCVTSGIRTECPHQDHYKSMAWLSG